MASEIKISILGDEAFNQNVIQSQKLRDNIDAIYTNAKKLSDLDYSLDELTKLVKESEKVNKSISEAEKNEKALKKAMDDYTASLEKSNNATKESNSELVKLNAEITKLTAEQKLLKTQSKENTDQFIKNKTTIKELRIEYNALEKQQIKEAKALQTITSLGQKTDLTLTEQRQLLIALNVQYDKMVVSEGKASAETLKLQQRINKLNTEVLQNNQAVGKSQGNVGNYTDKISQLKTQLQSYILKEQELAVALGKNSVEYKDLQIQINTTSNKLKTLASQQQIVDNRFKQLTTSSKTSALGFKDVFGAMTLAGLAQRGISLLTTEIKAGIETVNNYEEAIEEFGNKSKLTEKEIENLKDASLKLSNVNDQTSLQIVEGYKNIIETNPLLADNAAKIEEITNKSITLSDALGIDFLEATTLLTKGITATGDSADVLTNIFAATGLDADYLSEGLSKVQLAAKQANVPISDTAAALKVLSSSAENGGDAGGGLEKILRNLQKEGKGFESGQFNLNDALKEVNAELELANNDYERNLISVAAFGQKNVELGNVLVDNIDSFQEYSTQLSNSNIAEELAAKNSDNLKEKVAALKNSYDNFIITLANGENQFSDTVGGIVDFIAGLFQAAQESESLQNTLENFIKPFKNIFDIIGSVVDIFSIFKTGTDEAGEGVSTFSGIIDFLSFTLNIATTPIRLVTGLIKLLLEGITWLKDQILLAVDNLKLFIEKNAFLSKIFTVVKSQISGIVEAFGVLKDAIVSVLQKLDIISDSSGKTAQALSEIAEESRRTAKKVTDDNDDLTDSYDKTADAILNDLNAVEAELEDETIIVESAVKRQINAMDSLTKNFDEGLNKLKSNVQSIDKETFIDKIVSSLGLDEETKELVKESFGELYSAIDDYLTAKNELEIEKLQEKQDLIQAEIDAENAKLDELNGNLEKEKELWDDEKANDYLRTQSLISQSNARIAQAELEKQELEKQRLAAEESAKQSQKRAIIIQMLVDFASSISAAIKNSVAFSGNPIIAAINFAAYLAQITSAFLTARAAIKNLKKGEVLIKGTGTETSDSIPVNVSKNESVVTAAGSKRAPNVLTALNKDAKDKELGQAILQDFGLNMFKENVIELNYDSLELKKQVENQKRQIEQQDKQISLLSKMLQVSENEIDRVPTKDGYIEFMRNGKRYIKLDDK